MSTQTDSVPALDPVKEAQLNRELIDAVLKAESGELKQASSAGSKMIRRRIRENGFSRRILPPSVVSDSQLTRLPDTEYPAVVKRPPCLPQSNFCPKLGNQQQQQQQ